MSNMSFTWHKDKLNELRKIIELDEDSSPFMIDLSVILQKLLHCGFISTGYAFNMHRFHESGLNEIEKLADNEYKLTEEMRSALKALGFNYEHIFSFWIIDDWEGIHRAINNVSSPDMQEYYKRLFGMIPPEGDQSMEKMCDLFSEFIRLYMYCYKGRFALIDKRIISTHWLYDRLMTCKKLMPRSLSNALIITERATYAEGAYYMKRDSM